MNLDKMSLKELKDLQSQVAKAIASFEERKKKAALVELEEKARELGFSSLAELTGVSGKRGRAPSAPKFANPANRADTWTGRGRKPRWFSEGLAAGKSPEDMAI